jgi:hypothetical protein
MWLQLDPSANSCSFDLTDGTTIQRSWTISSPVDPNASFHIVDAKGSQGDAYAFP